MSVNSLGLVFGEQATSSRDGCTNLLPLASYECTKKNTLLTCKNKADESWKLIAYNSSRPWRRNSSGPNTLICIDSLYTGLSPCSESSQLNYALAISKTRMLALTPRHASTNWRFLMNFSSTHVPSLSQSDTNSGLKFVTLINITWHHGRAWRVVMSHVRSTVPEISSGTWVPHN
jgi:hypothetical protein